MLKKIILLFIFIMGFLNYRALAQHCYESYLANGKKDYNSGNYKKATEYFETGLKCIGTTETQKKLLNSWITKCNAAGQIVKNKEKEGFNKNEDHANSTKATLLLFPNMNCNINVDGGKMIHVKANGAVKVVVNLGEHLIVCESEDRRSRTEQTVEVNTNTQKIAKLDLKTLSNSRENDDNSVAATQAIIAEMNKGNKTDVNKIEEYIKKGALINSKDTAGNTALHWATNLQSESLVKFLLEKNAGVNETDKDGNTALHIAAGCFNCLNVAQLLLDKGANVNAINNRQETPLHRTEWTGSVEMGKLLINRGANVNARDDHGDMPLHAAARNGYVALSKLLLENGANANAEDHDELTPGRFAEILQLTKPGIYQTMIDLLRSYGATH